MFFSRPAGHRLIDRGDPDAVDKSLGDFNMDYTWRDIDLSAVVPANAAFVRIYLTCNSVSANADFSVRKKGNTLPYNISTLMTQVSDLTVCSTYFVPIGTDGKIQYRGLEVPWGMLNLTVLGWVV